MSYTSLFARPSPPERPDVAGPPPPVRHAIHLAVRPVAPPDRPVPPSLFALRARPEHDGVVRPLVVAA